MTKITKKKTPLFARNVAKLFLIVMTFSISFAVIIHRMSIIDIDIDNTDIRTDIIDYLDNSEITHNRPNTNTEAAHKPKFAYAFLIAGCDPKHPNYRGYIYNVLIAKYLFLKEFNSSTDVIVMIRMHESVKASDAKLPKEDEDLLTQSGVIVKYLPKPVIDNFHTAMMDKFRILEFTTYDRIIYLDSDILPLNNLDYMFELSMGENAKLEENVVLTYNREPSSGGFFMLSPKKGDYEEISAIIEKRDREGYHFNETIGWGHEMIPPDCWESLNGPMGTKWDFYGAFTDQGLLYYWTKYIKKRVSFINGITVKTWGQTNNQNEVQVVREEPLNNIFGNIAKHASIDFLTRHHTKVSLKLQFKAPYRDFHHFREKTKPWLNSNIKKMIHHEPQKFWYETLQKANKEYKFGIDVDHIGLNMPELGLFPAFVMVEKAKQAREKNDLLSSAS